MKNRIGKKDIIFLSITAVFIIVIGLFWKFAPKQNGDVVTISVNGSEYGSYPLDKDTVIPVKINGSVTNTLEIKDGKAKMVEANCPDQICVHQMAISKDGENIVCLPNKLIATVIGTEQKDIDSVAN